MYVLFLPGFWRIEKWLGEQMTIAQIVHDNEVSSSSVFYPWYVRIPAI